MNRINAHLQLHWHTLPGVQRLQRFINALNLRQRIAGSMMLLITATGLLLVVWVILDNRRLEQNVTYDLLAEELNHYQQQLHQDPGTEPLQSAQLRIYRSRDISELPKKISRLPPGTYGPLRINKRYLRALVRDTEFGRLYITYDISAQLVEQRIAAGLLALGLIITIFFTAWFAYALSNRLVSPVRQLAHRVSHLSPEQRHTHIAEGFAGNELEPIARSIDTFLERLDGFIEREQSFTATASHELRTPLAVIQGAVELISAQTENQPNTQQALARIQRAVREMTDFTAALLLLSREAGTDDPDSSCDLTTLLPRIIDDLQAVTPHKRIQLHTTAVRVRLQAPDSMVTMVLSNILRNALQHGTGNTVVCNLEAHRVSVTNAGHLSAQQLEKTFSRGYTTRAGGFGMGLYLARRICDRYHWQITVSNETTDVIATVIFS